MESKEIRMNILASALKSKGIGPEGSRHLDSSLFASLTTGFLDPEISETTKASLLVALRMLENNPEEQAWIAELQSAITGQAWAWILEAQGPELRLQQLTVLPFPSLQEALARTLLRQELSPELCQGALGCLLEQSLHLPSSSAPHQELSWLGAALLEAQRLKRETFAENRAFWQALRQHSQSLQTQIPLILDLADNYDGMNRSPVLAPAMAAWLAAAGIPVVLHGAQNLAPKKGFGTRDLLEAAAKPLAQSLEEAHQQILKRGWTYVDQEVYQAPLHSLKTLREEMVKRPLLATFEKLCFPIRGLQTWSLNGYTHSAYRSMLGQLMAAEAPVDRWAVVRGAEGTSRPSLARVALCVKAGSSAQDSHECSLDPTEFGHVIQEEAVFRQDPSAHWKLCLQALDPQDLSPEALTARSQVLFWIQGALELLAPEGAKPWENRLQTAFQSGDALGRLE